MAISSETLTSFLLLWPDSDSFQPLCSSSRKLASTPHPLGRANLSTLCEAVSLGSTPDCPLSQALWHPPHSQPTYLSNFLKAQVYTLSHRGEGVHARMYLSKPSTSCLAVGNQLLPCCQDSAVGIEESPLRIG